MRVLLVTPQYLPIVGGAERQAHALARMLLARGHQVLVLTRPLPLAPPHEIVDAVPVVRAIRTIELGPLYGILYILSVVRFLLRRRHDWDVIHITHVYLDAFAAVLTRRLHGLPVVVRPACAGYYGDLARLGRFRAWPVFPGPRGLALRTIVRSIAQADAFIANSRELQEELIGARFPPERITRIPNGVDVNHFHPDPGARLQEARGHLGLPLGPLLVFAGRLDPQKGLQTLIEVMRSPSVEASGAHLVLLGEGPQRTDLEAAVRRDGLAARVLLRGLVDDVAPYLRAADIFVFPSVGEGMPNALLEAMATGLPCVASAIGGCQDAITDHQTGLLVPPGDTTAFHGALKELLQSPVLRERLGAAARQDAVTRFGLEKMVERYEACYRTAIARGPMAPTIGAVSGERP